jgi:hypothetical protein
MLLRSDDVKMMNHISDLASQIVERGDYENNHCESETENNAKNDGDNDSVMTVTTPAPTTVTATATRAVRSAE